MEEDFPVFGRNSRPLLPALRPNLLLDSLIITDREVAAVKGTIEFLSSRMRRRFPARHLILSDYLVTVAESLNILF